MPTVLVVDDDKGVRNALDILLKSRHFGVFLAGDGVTGINLIATKQFDAVMVDIFMPGLDGLATIRQIRAAHGNLPIIAMSGRSFTNVSLGKPDFLGMAVKLGADAALQKPFSSRELFQTLDRLLVFPTMLRGEHGQETSAALNAAFVDPSFVPHPDVQPAPDARG